jgi:Rne/Rng family ribonuclease
MSKELVISASRHETRVAMIEDDQVVEVFHQRENEYSLAGSIHKGRVTRVLPGMQSAFVDIGLDRDAFLYVSDFFEDNEEYDKIVTSVEEQVLKLGRSQEAPLPPAAPPATVSGEREAPPAAAAEEPVAAAAPVAPPGEPRRDERGGGDRDRRGRRGRRRHSQKGPGNGGGGRGLPDSKFYSPRGDAEPRREPEERREIQAPPPPPVAAAPSPAPASGDDIFVLPGESLAKYTGPGEASDREVTAIEPAPTAAAEEAAPELVSAMEELVDAIDEAPPVAGISAEEPETVAVEVSGTAAETAGDADLALSDAAESLDADEPADADEPVEAAPEGEQPIVQDEGPEPARIPTSLTATLREQNPRYLHRVSRRMRRKGRGDRGPTTDGPRPPQGEGRPEPRNDQRTDSRNEPRNDQRNEPREPRPEPRPEQRTVPAPVRERADRPPAPSIADLLKEGQEIIVQIAKEPLGQKGARITSHIALPGRFLVYMPTVDHIGVSRKIPSDEERSRLKRVLQTHRTGIPGGYIVRTAGDGRTEEELRADMMFLYNMWLDMRQKAERRPAPMLIHHDLNVVERVLRDQLTSAFKSIWVDNEEVYENVLSFVQRFQPALVGRVKLYTRSNPIFDEFNITSELEKALRPKVWLKSGGYIVINQTEALVAIDINTGKYVGKSNRLEDTIVKTNTDAIKEIVRQIRLRDLGGIIVVDFIDMDERKNRQKVMQALEEAMRNDRAPYKILQFNDFGLVAITRKRVKQSLERTLCTPCPYCEGAGYVKSPLTVVGEILQEAHKIAKAVEGKDVMLRVAPEVAKLLKSNQNSYLQEMEEVLGRTVIVKSDQQLHQEKFDLM